MDKIRVSIDDSGQPISTVRVDGVVDTLTAGEVEVAIRGLLNRDRFKIIMDLAGVEYISSAGWGVFISHLKQARNNSGDLRLSGMIPNVQEIFELLEFDTILNSYPSVNNARQSFDTLLPAPEGGPRVPESSKGGLEELTAVGIDDPLPQVDAAGFTKKKTEPRSITTSITGDAEEFLIHLVAEDPFSTISEMKIEINESDRFKAVSWWWVYKTLRRRDLLSKRNRFRLARRNLRI